MKTLLLAVAGCGLAAASAQADKPNIVISSPQSQSTPGITIQ